MISFQINPWVAFGFPYLLIELFYIGMPVVRTDGRSLAWCTVTWLPNFLGWVDYHISLAMGLRRSAGRGAQLLQLWFPQGVTVVPREIEKNGCTKFWRGKQGALLSMFYVRINSAICVPRKSALFSVSLGTNKRLLSNWKQILCGWVFRGKQLH